MVVKPRVLHRHEALAGFEECARFSCLDFDREASRHRDRLCDEITCRTGTEFAHEVCG